MSTLDAILKYKALKEAQHQADLQAIPTAVSTIAAFQQQVRENQLKALTLRADLASKGLKMVQQPGGQIGFERDVSLQAAPTAKDLSTIGLNEAKKKESEAKASLLSQFTSGGTGDVGGMTLTGGTVGGLTFENTPAKLKIKEQEAEQALKVPTAKMKDDLQQITNAETNLNELEKTTKDLPSGYGAVWQNIANFFTRGSTNPELVTYNDSRKAIAVGLYRALTGDTRLSDADAASRALPLVWDSDESEALRESKFKTLKQMVQARKNLVQSGKYTKTADGDFITPIEAVKEAAVGSNDKKSESKSIPTKTVNIGGVSTTLEKRADGKWYPKKD